MRPGEADDYWPDYSRDDTRLAAIRAKRLAKVKAEPVARRPGYCSHCGKHIGRGVWGHERKCGKGPDLSVIEGANRSGVQ